MKRIVPLVCALLLFTTSLPVLTGCGSLKPVPVAEGHDPVVVFAERAQTSSLEIYKQVTEWEFANRANLPVGVSRAVDQVRKEFPAAWNESRRALALYKGKMPGVDASAIDRITGALLVLQDVLLNLQKNATQNEVTQLTSAIGSLVNSLQALFSRPPAAIPVPTNGVPLRTVSP